MGSLQTVPEAAVGKAIVGRIARVKALDPVTSTSPPSPAQVTEYSGKRIMLQVRRYMTMGTIAQLHLDGEFSLWKVFCCIPKGDAFYLGLELAKSVPSSLAK